MTVRIPHKFGIDFVIGVEDATNLYPLAVFVFDSIRCGSERGGFDHFRGIRRVLIHL